MRIAVVHIGLHGHVARNRRLGAVLASQGHAVDVWAPGAQRRELEETGVRFHPHEPLPVRNIDGGGAGFLAGLTEATERHLEGLIEAFLAGRIELVIHDYAAPWGRAAAGFLGLPSVASYPIVPSLAPAPEPTTATSPAPAPEPTTATGGAAPRRAPLVPAFPPGWEASVARTHRSRQAIERRWGLGPETWADAGPRPDDWTISFTLPDIAGVSTPPERWRFVGPLLAPDAWRSAGAPRPSGRPPGLGRPSADRRPLVYVSLGTFFTFVPEVLKAVVDGLSGEPVDVLISTGRGPVRTADLGPLPDNVEVATFVAAPEVLSRASLMISHCGSNSVHEAILAGVPLVCLPQAGDQFGWADRVARLGLGQVAAEDPDAIRAAVAALLRDGATRERVIEMAGRIASYDGAGELSRVVAEVTGS